MAVVEDVKLLDQLNTAPAARLPRGWAVLSYVLMALALIVMGLPLYWMLISAFKQNSEIYGTTVTWIPMQPTLENFPRAWNAAPFGRYYVNTILTTLVGSGAEIFFAVTSAYAFAFLRFPRKNVIFLLLLAALMVPDQVTILPNYLMIARLGWVDTYQGIIVPGAATAYGTFLLRQAMLSLPREVLEAARVDGAGHLRTMRSVVVPLTQPAIVTFGLISLVAKWNNFLWPLVATNSQEMRVLPIGIARLLDQEGTSQWGTIMAGTIFVVLPILIVFLWAQKYIVEGIAAGAVKG